MMPTIDEDREAVLQDLEVQEEENIDAEDDQEEGAFKKSKEQFCGSCLPKAKNRCFRK